MDRGESIEKLAGLLSADEYGDVIAETLVEILADEFLQTGRSGFYSAESWRRSDLYPSNPAGPCPSSFAWLKAVQTRLLRCSYVSAGRNSPNPRTSPCGLTAGN